MRERTQRRGVHVALALCLALPLPAYAQPRLDPAWIAVTTAPSCLPYETGAIGSAAHVGTDLVALTRTLDPLAPTGYDGLDGVHTIELRRTSDLSLIWSRVLDAAPSALAASVDARRIAVGTYAGVRVLEAASGTEIFRSTQLTHALAFGPTGELAISYGASIQVVDLLGRAERTIGVTGTAASITHAMMADGECIEIFDTAEAHVGAIAYARDGTLVASVSDGSVRAITSDDTQRWSRPDEREGGRGYRVAAVAFEPIDATTIRAIYGDGFTVTLRTPTMSASDGHESVCSASERAIATRRLGEAVEVEPPSCAWATSLDVDASGRTLFVAPIARVHSRSGGSLLVAPTVHDTAGLLVGDEAWLFGIDGTGERWALGAGGGRFLGALPIPGRAGVVLDVSDDGRFVAIGAARAETHGSETFDGYDLHVVDTRTETMVAGIAGVGARARFVPGGRVAIELDAGGHRAVEIRELAGGARVRRVALADAEYGGLVAADATRVVVAEGPHVRAIDVASGRETTIDLPDGVVEASSFVGNRLALRVYDRTTPEISDHRIDVLDLSGGDVRLVASAAGASGRDVQLVDDGAAAIYAGRDGIAHRLDVANGAVSDVPRLPAGDVAALLSTPAGFLRARSAPAGRPLFLDAAPTETTLLDWSRARDHAGASIVYELGGDAYVIGHDGRTRAMISVLDGGLVVRSVGGFFSVTSDARAAMLVHDGDALRPCDASMDARHVPGLLEGLLR